MEKRATLIVELFDPDKKAARDAQKAVLEEIYLVDTKTWRIPLLISPENLILEHKCGTQQTAPPEDLYEDRLDLHFILCKFRLTAFDDKSPNKPLMKIEAVFCTLFSLDFKYFYPSFDPSLLGGVPGVVEEPFDEKFSADFYTYLLRVNPITTAWPYWREFAQNMSARMGFPALTVPLLEIVPKKPEEKVKDDVAKKGSTRRKKLSA